MSVVIQFIFSLVNYNVGPVLTKTLIIKSMYEVSLFCRYEIHQTGMLQIVFLVSWKVFDQEECMGSVQRRLDLHAKVLEY